MSLFGQPQQQQQQTSNIFGGGNTQPQQQQSGGLFGASQTTAQPATTNIFGQPTTQQQQAPSLFGSTNTNTNQGGGGLFGAGGGLFGNTQQNQPAAGSSLFGNTQQQGTSLFGNNNAARPAGGIAGGPTLPSLTTNPTGGSSLFGGSTNTLGQQPTQTAGSSFFAQPNQQNQQNQQQQQRPPLFGGTGTSTNNIFGASTANNAPKPGGFGFGLGGQQQQQQQQNPLGASTLSTSMLRPPGAGPPQQQQQGADAQTQFARLTTRIEGIAAAWNASSPQCQFQYIFYNRVDPAQVGLYGRPPNATNDALWARAVRENPDPSCLVPAIAVGFDDLRQRVDAQGQQAVAHAERLKDLKTRLTTIASTHAQTTAPRLARLAAAQTQLAQRLLALAAHLHLLVPSLRGAGVGRAEEELHAALESMREEIGVRSSKDGGSNGRMRAKLGELWALVGALSAAREAQQAQGGGAGGAGGEWKVVDEEGLARIAQILGEQQAGLVHLTKILKGDLVDINVILKGEKGKKGEDEGEDLFGASSRRGR
ncbi:Adrenoleukodystrophy protein [Mycena venus]|uniref:Adrenoleukodystrophy protein n=1 Tax=Mycena venus TaxID=2733690 RepID=A0A8H6XL27_9AGAR|nr:Adrenoleukodystrophy protein [Mycena venus]